METNRVSCCGDIFGYAKVSTIVELCLSVIVNIGLLLGFLLVAYIWKILLMGIFILVLITTNTIIVIFELKSIHGNSIKKWNLVMRIIWTGVVGLVVILYLIQLISCTNQGRDACLIWDTWSPDFDLSVLTFSICLLIVGPMFLYGIFKSFLLHKVLKSQSYLPQQLGLPLTRLSQFYGPNSTITLTWENRWFWNSSRIPL